MESMDDASMPSMPRTPEAQVKVEDDVTTAAAQAECAMNSADQIRPREFKRDEHHLNDSNNNSVMTDSSASVPAAAIVVNEREKFPPSSSSSSLVSNASSHAAAEAASALMNAKNDGRDDDREDYTTPANELTTDSGVTAGVKRPADDQIESFDENSANVISKVKQEPAEAGESGKKKRARMNAQHPTASNHFATGTVTVFNDERLLYIPDDVTPCSLGHVLYTGAKPAVTSDEPTETILFLLPPLDSRHWYNTIEVRIPAEFLLFYDNVGVRNQAVWGTDVYTDDSDVVAMLIHSGAYRPLDAPVEKKKSAAVPNGVETTSDERKSNGEAIANGKANHEVKEPPLDNPSAAPRYLVEPLPATPISHARPLPKLTDIPVVAAVPSSTDGAASSNRRLLPPHDLSVTLRILPRLARYTGSTRHGLASRSWGAQHMGESVRIESVKPFPLHWAASTSRRENVVAVARGCDSMARLVFSPICGEILYKYDAELMFGWPLDVTEAVADKLFYEGLVRSSNAPPVLIQQPGGGSSRSRNRSAPAIWDNSESERASALLRLWNEIGGFDAGSRGLPSVEYMSRLQDQPFWRIRMRTQCLWIESRSGKSYEMSQSSEPSSEHETYTLAILGSQKRSLLTLPAPVSASLCEEVKTASNSDVLWREEGLVFAGMEVDIVRILWRRRD